MKTILILASNPYGDLRIDREIRDLTAAIDRSKNTQEFAVVPNLAVRPGDLHDIFVGHNPYVVHFCGHGAGEEGLVFESDHSGEQLVSNQALSGLFSLFGQNVECVLLNACTTEIQANVISQHVPYVVGTSREILDRAAYFFAVGFYKALGNGESIEVSFARGCNAVELELPNVRIVSNIAETWRKAKVVGAELSTPAEPLTIILKRNSSLNNPEPAENISSEFRQTIHAEAKRKDYYDNLRNVLDRFGKTSIRREKPISEFEKEQRRTLLNKVQVFWIEGFLKPSLYFNTAIDKNRNDSSQVLQPLDNLEVIPFDIDKSYDELQQTDITGQIGGGKTLLILGEPGSGKTIALLQLAERLIKQTQENMKKPIPVVFNLSSWGQKQPPIEEWLIEELRDKYQVPKTWSEPWLKEQQLTLLLDGLDEVKENYRNACVRAINKFITTHLEIEIVVCSRIKDYEALAERLLLSSAICIQPLSQDQLLEFLKNTDDSLSGLKTVIEQDKEVAEFAQTPLILNMMTWTYQGWSAQECSMQFRIAKDRKFNLFESYIEKNLEREDKEQKYPKAKVLNWLSWLAKTMVNESKIIFLIEKLQPTLLQNRSEKRSYQMKNFRLAGLIFGLIWGLISVLFFGLLFGLLGGVIFGSLEEINLFEQISWSWRRAMLGVRLIMYNTLIGVPIVALIGVLTVGLGDWLINMTVSVLIVALISGLFHGLSSTEVKQRTFPNQGIQSSIKNSVKVGLIGGLVTVPFAVLTCGLIGWLSDALLSRLDYMVTGAGGLMCALAIGQLLGLNNGGATCIQHLNLRRILYRKGRIPWNYARFLDYASERLLMKKVGGGYVFYHRMLMEHFARKSLN